MTIKLKPFVLRDSEWLRASVKRNQTVLWDAKEQKGCCLGLIARQWGGAKVKDLYYDDCPVNSPEDVSAFYSNKFPWLLNSHDHDSKVAKNLMDINDNLKTSDKEKVEKMKPIFKKHGYRLIWKPNE